MDCLSRNHMQTIPIIEFRKGLVNAKCGVSLPTENIPIVLSKAEMHRLSYNERSRYRNWRQFCSCYKHVSAKHRAEYARNRSKKCNHFLQ